MLYAILCYNEEDVVWSWSREQERAVMTRLGAVQERLAKDGKMGPSLRLLPPRPCAEYGYPLQQPQGFSLMLRVDDIDAWWSRAIDSGAAAVMPVQDMFWGDRYGQLRDPFGILWALTQPIRKSGA